MDGKFKPFDASTNQLHDCPNSEWNKKKQQGEAYRTPKPNAITDFEARVLDKLELLERKLDAVYSGRAFQDEDQEPEVIDAPRTIRNTRYQSGICYTRRENK